MSRLDSQRGSEALRYDWKFVSAVYFQLPERHKTKWLEFDTSSHPNKWAALLVFLDTSYEYTVKKKLLLASYTPTGKLKARAFAAQGEETEEDKQKNRPRKG